MSTLMTAHANSRSLVGCFKLLNADPCPQCEAAHKDKLRGIHDEDGCRPMLLGKVNVEPKLTQEIRPSLVPEDVHL
jgi:hypothetical protein